jgi:hypothetical protein
MGGLGIDASLKYIEGDALTRFEASAVVDLKPPARPLVEWVPAPETLV